MAAWERIKERLPNAPDDQLYAALDDARELILGYTARQEMPEALEGTQAALAVVLYNRQGIEGETAHSEGGVSRTMEAIPGEIKARLRPWRLARVVNVHETA